MFIKLFIRASLNLSLDPRRDQNFSASGYVCFSWAGIFEHHLNERFELRLNLVLILHFIRIIGHELWLNREFRLSQQF